jgi:PAS domain S-box-containing protein
MEQLKAAWRKLNARVDELGAERQQYLELFERACEAYLITDTEGVIREANGAAVDLLRRRRRALRGKPLAALVPLLQRREFRNRLASVAARRSAWRTLVRTDESVIEIEVAVQPSESGMLCWRLRAVN